MITLNSFGNCQSDLLGSGLTNCDRFDYGDLMGVIPANQAVKWDLESDTMDKAELLLKIKQLKMFPYVGSTEFTENTADNEQNTSSLGIIESIRQGKPYYELEFRNGFCGHRSLYNKRGFMKWNTIMVFSEGILMTVSNDGKTLKPFTTGDFSVETLRLKQGTDLQRTMVKFQLLNPNEFNDKAVFFTWEALGMDISDLAGVIETKLDVVIDSTTEISVKVTSACNSDFEILGLDDISMWQLDGVPETITTATYNTGTGRYDLIFSSAVVEATIKLSDGTYDVVEDLDGSLYKGKAKFDTTPPSA